MSMHPLLLNGDVTKLTTYWSVCCHCLNQQISRVHPDKISKRFHDTQTSWVLTKSCQQLVSEFMSLTQKRKTKIIPAYFLVHHVQGKRKQIHVLMIQNQFSLSTLIGDHRNSPVLVPVPIRKFLFPVQWLKRSSGRLTSVLDSTPHA